MDKGLSRDQVAEYAGMTRPQLNHIMKLDLVRSDMGDVRKRISELEALFAIIAAELMKYTDPRAIVPVIGWLREDCKNEEPNGTRRNLYWAAGGSKPMYLMVSASIDGEWLCEWSNNRGALDGAVSWITIELRNLFRERSVQEWVQL